MSLGPSVEACGEGVEDRVRYVYVLERDGSPRAPNGTSVRSRSSGSRTASRCSTRRQAGTNRSGASAARAVPPHPSGSTPTPRAPASPASRHARRGVQTIWLGMNHSVTDRRRAVVARTRRGHRPHDSWCRARSGRGGTMNGRSNTCVAVLVATAAVLSACSADPGGARADASEAKRSIVDVVEHTTASIGGEWSVYSGPAAESCDRAGAAPEHGGATSSNGWHRREPTRPRTSNGSSRRGRSRASWPSASRADQRIPCSASAAPEAR